MTETRIRQIAEATGLNVAKRITTGNERRHFATFELTGQPPQIGPAWNLIRTEEDPARLRPGFTTITRVTNNDRPDAGAAYIMLESVWCDEGDACRM